MKANKIVTQSHGKVTELKAFFFISMKSCNTCTCINSCDIT